MTFDELNEVACYDDVYYGKSMGMVALKIPPILQSGGALCDIKVRKLYLGIRRDSPMHGIMVGILEYEGEFYKFHAQDCGEGFEMNCLDKIVVKNRSGIDFVETTDESFGRWAFDKNTSVEDLKDYGEEHYQLRIVMDRLRVYCSGEEICKLMAMEGREQEDDKER